MTDATLRSTFVRSRCFRPKIIYHRPLKPWTEKSLANDSSPSRLFRFNLLKLIGRGAGGRLGGCRLLENLGRVEKYHFKKLCKSGNRYKVIFQDFGYLKLLTASFKDPKVGKQFTKRYPGMFTSQALSIPIASKF